MVFLCFFSSMFITNDVALITFVPLSILILKMAQRESLVCITVILQTIAANLGSMLTPIGNPQNLYLYTRSQYSMAEFILTMLPYTLISGAFLVLGICLIGQKDEGIEALSMEFTPLNKKRFGYYLTLFFLCLLSVVKILRVEVLFVIILASLLLENRNLLMKIDYGLLLTFVAFFVLIGNLGRFPMLRDFVTDVFYGHEALTAVVASQVISNVPAALVLSEFTSQWKDLIVGTNLGGLGTLIASMASLISYKQIALEYPHLKGRYLINFTVWNLAFLGVLMVPAILL